MQTENFLEWFVLAMNFPDLADWTELLIKLPIFRLHRLWPGPGEPAGGRFYQRAAAAQPHPPQNRRDGRHGNSPLRHLTPTARFTRLCVENTLQVRLLTNYWCKSSDFIA